MSNSTNGSNTIAQQAIPVEFYDIIFNVVGCLIVGQLGIVWNAVAFVAILTNKRLNSPCFKLMAGECLYSFFMAAGIFIGAIDTACQQIGWAPKKRQRIMCYAIQSLLPALTTTVSALLACLISIDRLISILMPLAYRKAGLLYAYVCLLLCLLYSVGAVLAGIFIHGASLYDVIPCTKFSDSYSPAYNSYYKGVNLFICCLCVGIYAVMFASFYFKIRKLEKVAKNNNKDEKNQFIKQQMAVMPAVKLLMILYTLTGVAPTIVGNVLTYVENGIYFPRGYQYNYVVKACNPLAEVVALFIRSKEFRLGVFRLIGRGPSNDTLMTNGNGKSRATDLQTVGGGGGQRVSAATTTRMITASSVMPHQDARM